MKQVESLIEIKRGANMRNQTVDVRLPIETPVIASPRRKMKKKTSSRRLEGKVEKQRATEEHYDQSDAEIADLADLHFTSPAPSIELDRATSLHTEKSCNMTSPAPVTNNAVVTTHVSPPEVAVLR